MQLRVAGWIILPQRLKLCKAVSCYPQVLLNEPTLLTKLNYVLTQMNTAKKVINDVKQQYL